MDEKQTSRFWGRAFMSDEERPLAFSEQALIAAAVIPGESRWDGACDVERMAAVVRQDAAVLQSVGPALINITLSTRGCAPALKYLLERNVPFLIDEYRAKEGKEHEYDCVHEASWAGCTDNLRVLFESGVADATGTSNPHTGWPDNVSLLYWPAVFGGTGENTESKRDSSALTSLLLKHGADPEIRIKGNGERGNTALQEALSPGHKEEWENGKRQVALVLIDYGAHYDAFCACALDDLDRLRECYAKRSDVALSTGEANMTPLHRATYQGWVEAAEALIVLGADTTVEMKSGKGPLEVARLDCKFLKQ